MNSQTTSQNNSFDTEKKTNIIAVAEAVSRTPEEATEDRLTRLSIIDDYMIDGGKKIAQAYQNTGFGKAMDNKNKNALKVAAEQGFPEAAKHMMNMAGGDYSRMRSMFG